MRILLDENFPADFALLLVGHETSNVHSHGWAGVKNGELLRRAHGMCEVFVTLDRNDAHLKNFAVLYENPEAPVRLAPSYDFVCTTLYQAHDVLALTLDDSKSFPNRKRLATFAHTTCNLTGATAADLLDRVVAGVRRAVKDIRRYSREHSDFASAGAKLIAAFERGAASVASC
jgi:serine/threonine-protein kinase HipA